MQSFKGAELKLFSNMKVFYCLSISLDKVLILDPVLDIEAEVQTNELTSIKILH